MQDGSPKGRDAGACVKARFTTATSPKARAPTPGRMNWIRRPFCENFPMGMKNDDDTVYCDVQIPLAQGRELLQLVSALRESKAHSTLDRVFERMQD